MQQRDMTMRIVGGFYRSRLIKVPTDRNNIRPTKDRIREALFSILSDVSNKTFLDMYAGSGAMGIEAISHGVNKSYFIDNNTVAIKTIRENLLSLNINNSKYDILFEDDFAALNQLENSGVKFDIVFIDPPYELGEYEKIYNRLLNSSLLNESAIMIFESNKDLNIDPSPFKKFKTYKYGEIILTIGWK